MVKFENFKVHNLENAINGVIDLETSDSKIGLYLTDYADELIEEIKNKYDENNPDAYIDRNDNITNIVAIGPSDLNKLKLESRYGNTDFLKYITVTGEITAPLSWWNEFDRHWIGTSVPIKSLEVSLADKPFCIDSFDTEDFYNIEYPLDKQREDLQYPIDPNVIQLVLIPYLNYLRELWLMEKDKNAFKELKRWLPTSYIQTRKIMTNYGELAIICNSAYTDWSRTLVPIINELPYLKDFII